MKIDVQADFSRTYRALELLHEDIRGPALVSAVNKTIDQGRTRMVRGISREFNISATDVRQRLSVKRASKRRGFYAIEGALVGGDGRKRAMNIIRFVERSVTLTEARWREKAGTRKLLFVKVKRTGPAKALRGAFIANKGRTVFHRRGKERLPIDPVQVIDVPQMFNTKRINSEVTAHMRTVFPTILRRETAFYIRRFNQGQR